MNRKLERGSEPGTQATNPSSSSDPLATPGGKPDPLVTPTGPDRGPITPGVFAQTEDWKLKTDSPRPDSVDPGTTQDESAPILGEARPSTDASSSYAIEGEVARGGLGRILKAYDRRLGRRVALKELLHASNDSAARFLREALVTARLQHPAIVPVYEAGYWKDGSPFYAMKLVSGRSLQDVIAQAHTLEERLAMLPNMIAIAEAVAYAHSEGIVHRDLKPANVLVGSFGETVVIDWGLAKHVAETSDSKDLISPYPIAAHDLTIVGSVLGTPAYMAPEQARGSPANRRGDVYALGAMLYHLLSGGPPYSGNSAKEVLQKVAVASAPPPLEERQPRAPPDLCAIVRKAMAPNPGERYPSANELAADLKRFQTGQLVSAHVYSTWSLVQRFIARHRATVSVATVLVLALIATAAVSVQRIVRERNRAEARTHELILMQARSSLDPDPTAAIAWLKTFPTDVANWGAVRVIAADARERGVARRVLRGHQGNVPVLAFLPGGKRLVSASYDRTVRIWDLDSHQFRVLTGHEDAVTVLAASLDGKRLATSSGGAADLFIRIWDVETGRQIQAFAGEKKVWFLAFSRDGKSLASCGDDGLVRLWNLSTGEPRVLGNHPDRVHQVAFSPDGSKLASISRDGSVRLWDLQTERGRELGRHSASANRAVFSPDGRQLASCSEDKTIRLWDLANGTSIALQGHEDEVNEVRFSPDGRILASASEDKSIRLWDLQGRSTGVLRGHQNAVKYIAFSPDGRTLASGSTDKTVRLWNLANGESRVLRGHSAPVKMVEFSPTGDAVASASDDDTLRVWEVGVPDVLRSTQPFRHIAFSPDSSLLVAGGDDRMVQFWSFGSGEVRKLPGHEGSINWAVFFPDGRSAATGSSDRTIRVWNVDTGESRALKGHSEAVTTLLITKDGKTLISGSSDRTIRLWDLTSGTSAELKGHTGEIHSLALSPTNRLLASSSRDKTVRLWDLSTHQSQLLGTMITPRIRRVAFSNDERFLAAASLPVRVWDIRSGRAEDLPGQRLRAVDLAFSADGKLISGGNDKRLTVWDLRSGKTNALSGHDAQITSLDISPDGRRLASASWYDPDHLSTLRLWDLDTGESRVLHGHSGEVKFVRFSPDGKSVASASADGTVRVWRDDLPMDPNALHAWMERATDATVTAR